MPRFVKRQKPTKYKDYASYKPFLRKDYFARCCYCGVPEAIWAGPNHFTVEHFRPKSLFPELSCFYPNLHYCCDDCNRVKGPKWPSPSLISAGFEFWMPTRDRSLDHFVCAASGELGWLSPMGEFTVKSIRLNRIPLVDLRKNRIRRAKLYRELLVSMRQLRNEIDSIAIQAVKDGLLGALELQADLLEEVRSSYRSSYPN